MSGKKVVSSRVASDKADELKHLAEEEEYDSRSKAVASVLDDVLAFGTFDLMSVDSDEFSASDIAEIKQIVERTHDTVEETNDIVSNGVPVSGHSGSESSSTESSGESDPDVTDLYYPSLNPPEMSTLPKHMVVKIREGVWVLSKSSVRTLVKAGEPIKPSHVIPDHRPNSVLEGLLESLWLGEYGRGNEVKEINVKSWVEDHIDRLYSANYEADVRSIVERRWVTYDGRAALASDSDAVYSLIMDEVKLLDAHLRRIKANGFEDVRDAFSARREFNEKIHALLDMEADMVGRRWGNDFKQEYDKVNHKDADSMMDLLVDESEIAGFNA